VRAFDTGPGVTVIDAVVRRIAPSTRYDHDGRIAAEGRPVEEVVTELLADPYFGAEPPKSTGRELFDEAYVTHFVEQGRATRPGNVPTATGARGPRVLGNLTPGALG